MSCDRNAQVHAYHDDALAPASRVELEAHLESCTDCRALLADLRSLSNLIAAAPLATMSPEAMARLSKSWRAARDRGLMRITSWLTAAAAAVLIGALLLYTDRTTTPNTTIATGHGNGDPVAASWETVALMPPTETEDNVPEIVLATWMANDLSYTSGERQR
jgi:anti-sigma factor RsiW